jgi:hypothetical protein
MANDGRNATKPYRVRAGVTWYWVDPAVPRSGIEPGDTVVVYPASDEPHVVVLQHADDHALTFATPAGETFALAPAGIVAMHLAAVDDEQDGGVDRTGG